MSMTRALVGFALAGAAASLTHVVTAIALIESLGLHPAAANGLAFAVATAVSYIGNTRWSFQARFGLTTAWRFLLVCLASGLLTMLIAAAVQRVDGHYLLGIALVLLLVPPVSFMAHRHFTYKT